MSAPNILRQSAQTIEDRATERDQPGGERSMGRTVDAFNALTGHKLTERDGWLFMCALKMARACTTPTGRPDDYVDLAAYGALAGECVAAPVPVNENLKTAKRTIIIEGLGEVEIRPGHLWVAQDANGDWWSFRERPITADRTWRPVDGYARRIGTTSPNDDWKMAIHQVPA